MAIPSSKGWESADWQGWFERLQGRAVARLKDLKGGKGNAAKHVHETRKILKRLRMGTRLMRGFVKKKPLRKTKETYRNAARFLAGSRDGTVRLNTFDAMMEMSGKPVEGRLAEVRATLEKDAVRAAKTAGDGAMEALDLLESFRLGEECWRARGKDDLKKNLARILGRAQEYFDPITEDCDEEYHELRKRVKDLYYALGVLPGDGTKSRRRVLMEVHVFEQSLGLQNDLAVLMDWFADQRMGPDEFPEFWQIATPAAAEFRRLILEDGAVLDEFDERGRFRKVFLP
jgi:CHAD domain-containing protein